MHAAGITVECVQTDNGFEFTNRFLQQQTRAVRRSLSGLLLSWASGTS